MKTIWNEPERTSLVSRLRTVREEMKPRWGRMSAAAMLSHLEASLRMALGELPARRARLRLTIFPLKQLVIYVLPFPKGAPTLPELLVTSGLACDITAGHIERLLATLAGFTDEDHWPEHPILGRLSHRALGHLMWKHMDHHLRQFGV